MKKISKDQVIMLHSMVIKPFQSFSNEELYPSIQGKAARLCYSIINNHPFIDGNKRIGILAMLMFLKIKSKSKA